MPFLTGGQSKATVYANLGAKNVSFDLPFRSESINPRANTITSEAILGNRAIKGATVTTRTYQGSLDIELFDITDSATTPTFKHHLLGFVFYSILGSISSETVSLGTSAPKWNYLVIEHGTSSSKLQWKDLYVTGVNVRFPADGIPTATLDVLTTGTDDATISGYTSVISASSYASYYNSSHLTLKSVSTSVTSVRNFELSLNMDTLQATTFGSLDVAEITPNKLEMAQVNIEFYINSFSDTLYAAVLNTYNSGAMSTGNITLEIDSPIKTGTKAILTLVNYYVTELSHDISGNDYIVCRATLQVPADKITLDGIAFKTA